MSNEIKSVEPMNGYELVMRDMGSRYARGTKLTFIEEGMAMTATAALDAKRFGPTPAEMTLPASSLPENVKGALASYSA